MNKEEFITILMLHSIYLTPDKYRYLGSIDPWINIYNTLTGFNLYLQTESFFNLSFKTMYEIILEKVINKDKQCGLININNLMD